MRDLRRYARQTNFRLVAVGLFLVFVVGLGLIYAIYGPAATVSGFFCLLAGLTPFIGIFLVLYLMDLWVRWYNRDT